MSIKNNQQKKVYLVPRADDTWQTVVSPTRPDVSAAVLVPEGVYPVDLYYRRTDLNGSGVIEKDTCQTRDALTRSLDWIGQCGYLILSLWDYRYDMPMDHELVETLDRSYERGHLLRQQALADLEEPSECRPLNVLIREAQEKAGNAPSPDTPDRSPEI